MVFLRITNRPVCDKRNPCCPPLQKIRIIPDFLGVSRAVSSAPTHPIIGARDGVVSFDSAHLDSAVSEVIVPTGHDGFVRPSTIREIKRILKSAKGN
jgi:hypothetical protein